MKKTEVEINGVYTVKVSGRMCRVKITGERQTNLGGWLGENLETGRTVTIRSAQRLRRPV